MSMPARNLVEYTVSELSAAVKRAVEDGFSYVRVRGEISGYRGPHSSGHAYFSLKDDRARLEAVVWRTTLIRLRFKPQEGLEVVATGRLTTFPGSSKYQMIVDLLEPAGVGALMALLDERRKKLAAEGLFDAARKRPLPFLPRVIGVVTSPTGAVIRDILHRLADRFPVHVIVWPVKVQGETSAAEVAAAIAGFNRLPPGGRVRRPDVVIVARGGGSLEDLWGFNEEIVVRATAESAIPVIAAVGHETDVTLIDHAADRRAPTPTAAAEMAVPVRAELVATVEGLGGRQRAGMLRRIETARRDLLACVRALPRADDLLAVPRRSLDEFAGRLKNGFDAATTQRRLAFERAAGRLSLDGLRGFLTHQGERLHALGWRARQVESLLRLRRDRLTQLTERKLRALEVHAERKRAAFAAVGQRLRPEAIGNGAAFARRRLIEAAGRMERGLAAALQAHRERLRGLAQLLASLSYQGVLARGYALVTSRGRLVTAAGEVTTGSPLTINLHDGKISAVSTTGPVRRTGRRPGSPAPGQGSLFDE
jgi:exodeoxyribonuclease VII large subunit